MSLDEVSRHFHSLIVFSNNMIEVVILILIMIAGSILALENENLMSAVIMIATVGLCLSVAFLLLGAPDLAMMQLVLEIVLIVILLRATAVKDVRRSKSGKDYLKITITLGLTAIFLYAGYQVICHLPIFGKPLSRIFAYYLNSIPRPAATENLVTAVAVKCRFMDSICALTALFIAVIGVVSFSQSAGTSKNVPKEEE